MQYTQTHAQHFFCFQQMADIRPAVADGMPDTGILPRSAVGSSSYFALNRFSFPMIRVYMAMASVPCLGKHSQRNQLPGLPPPEYLPVFPLPSDKSASPPADAERTASRITVHLLMALPDCQAADCISVQIQLTDLLVHARYGYLRRSHPG